MAKPTVLFVHGSWHSPKHFQPARDAFEQAGYPTECPCQPTFNAKPGTASMQEDAKCIRSLLEELVEAQSKDVICVLHSYGGVVGTEAIHESLGKIVRQKSGLNGGVIGLLYMAAFLLPLGASLGSAFGGSLPPFIQVEVRNSFLTIPCCFDVNCANADTVLVLFAQDDDSCNVKEPHRRFYNDLPKQDQDHWVSELRPQPAIAQLTPLTYTAYKYHPVTYLYCENDEGLPFEVQKTMVEHCDVNLKIETCTAGHSPFLSQIDTLLWVVERMAE